MRDAIKRIYYERNGERGNVPLDDLVDDDYQGGDYWLPASPAPHTPESDLLDDDRELWIKAMVLSVAEVGATLLANLVEKRIVHKQAETIRLTFMDRMTDEQIAAKLRKTKGAVQLLRTHALVEFACAGFAYTSVLGRGIMNSSTCRVGTEQLLGYLDDPSAQPGLSELDLQFLPDAPAGDGRRRGGTRGSDRTECQKVLREIPASMAAEASDEATAERFGPVRLHLLLCHDCFEAYREAEADDRSDSR